MTEDVVSGQVSVVSRPPRDRSQKAPFPWFGGKSKAAPVVWAAMGDVHHYVEPFAGSLAVLLARPHLANRPYFSETVNDADGLLCNAWRAIQLEPDATAEAASWPVSEADVHARHLALVRWREAHQLEHLMGDHAWCDPQIAGWWLYGIACLIGAGWCSGGGGWIADPEGRLYRPERGGAKGPSIKRGLPVLSDDGRGVETMTLREPGISRKIPTLSANGLGVEHAGLREPGLSSTAEPETAPEYHPICMPQLRTWLRALSARLRHVRIVHGDWARVCTQGAVRTLSVRHKQGAAAGIFLDPPYGAKTGRDMRLYTCDDGDLAALVAAWALAHGDRPDYRIVLAGMEGEHGDAFMAAGWREVRWYKSGFLSGGYANRGSAGTKNHQERLWLSPHCLGLACHEVAPDQRVQRPAGRHRAAPGGLWRGRGGPGGAAAGRWAAAAEGDDWGGYDRRS